MIGTRFFKFPTQALPHISRNFLRPCTRRRNRRAALDESRMKVGELNSKSKEEEEYIATCYKMGLLQYWS